MYDLIIIGAGPAGMSAALYALRANKKVLILESRSYGGQIIDANKIENYPGIPKVSGIEYASILFNQIIELGVNIKYEKVIKIDEDKNVITNENIYQGKGIIIATGLEHRKLRVEGEEEFIGKGVSYCATCDGNFYKNKVVAVIGGGNTALCDTLYLSDIASKVYLIHRRDTFRGEDKYLQEIKTKSNVEIILNSNVVNINGKDTVDNILVLDKNKITKTLEVDGVFIAVGQVPKNDIFKDIIEIDDAGYIISKDGVHTSLNSIYVAGDIRVKKLRQLVTAVSDGALAATTAIDEIRK